MDLLLDQLIDRADEIRNHTEWNQEEQSSEIFSYAMMYLKDSFPDRHVRELATTAWELIEKSISFIEVGDGGKGGVEFEVIEFESPLPEEAHVVIPANWILLFLDDSVYQLGSVLFAAVQIVDHYNNQTKTDLRCMMFEAELLLRVLETYKYYTLDTTQKASLDAYPEGVQGTDGQNLLYRFSPVFIAEA